jgi:glycosyltransferase involved in cell wall biosynthesis
MQAGPALEDARESAMSFLGGIVSTAGSVSEHPSDRARAGLEALAAAWRPPQDAPPPDLVGRGCTQSPPAWHLANLLELFGNPKRADSEVELARCLYHARWLGHLLMPERLEFRPVVTIIIPVYNRAAMAVEAVESCLAQSWKPLEILVVDDGSTDGLSAALAPFGGVVRLVRQPNGGVSRARNAGIRHARGDFIHFLDSDNLLFPSAVARKVDAFARLPDSELCYSMAEISGEHPSPLPRIPPPDGSANCPTTSLLADAPRYPFYVSCVMLPRFTLLATGGFEEDLRRGEDSRFWIRLAIRDAKVIGLGAKLTHRRLSRASLSAARMPSALHLLIRSRTTADLLEHRRAWHLAVYSFTGLLHGLLEHDEPSRPDDPDPELERLLAAIGALGMRQPHADGSPLPLLVVLRHLTQGALRSSRARRRTQTRPLLSRLLTAIDDAMRTAGAVTPADISYWARASATRTGGRRLSSFLIRADDMVQQNPSLAPMIDDLLRAAAGIPPRRAIRRYVWLRRARLPRRPGLWLALRKMW